VKKQLAAGALFFDVARTNSSDRESAVNGGFLGDVDLTKATAAWGEAAAKLRPGEVSDVIGGGGKYYIAQRMPRNLREDAEAHFNAALELRKSGDRGRSAAELLQALRIYPRFLRALTYLGVTYAESGDPRTASGILKLAIRLYPDDAGAHFNLAIAYGAMGNAEEISEYRKALAIDPDLVLGYLNLGAALYSKGEYDGAIAEYRKGIEVNPLVASLHYSLSFALEHQGKNQEAKAETALAQNIDPNAGR
jgi:tetratricopeptide (TPR) repeat protein